MNGLLSNTGSVSRIKFNVSLIRSRMTDLRLYVEFAVDIHI
jgi:hypothetical protein